MNLITKLVANCKIPYIITKFSIRNNRDLTLNEIGLLKDSICNTLDPEFILEFYVNMEGLSKTDIFDLADAMIKSVNQSNTDLLIEFSKVRPLDDKIHYIFIETIYLYDQCTNGNTLVRYYKENKKVLSKSVKNTIFEDIRELNNADNIIEITSEPEVKNNKKERIKFTNTIINTLNTDEYKNCYDDLDKNDVVNKLIKYYKEIDTLSEKEQFTIIKNIVIFAPDKFLVDIILDPDIELELEVITSIFANLIKRDSLIQIQRLVSNYDIPVSCLNRIIEYVTSKPLKENEYNILLTIYKKTDNMIQKKTFWNYTDNIAQKKAIWDYIVSEDKPKFIIDFIMNVDNSIVFTSTNPKFKSIEEFINYINSNISDNEDRLQKIDEVMNVKRLIKQK